MKQRKKRGFTIVEMLMVIAVLAVLTGIVASAASAVIHKSRVRKIEALRAALQSGIATCYQQEGHWPPGKTETLQKWATGEEHLPTRSEGKHVAQLPDDDYDNLVRYLVVRCLNASGNPIMDVSGFTATRKSAADKKDPDGNPTCYGEEVRSWVAKQQAKDARGSAPKSSEMTFGYSKSEKGYFRRFRIIYNADSDSVTVEYAQKKSGNDWVDDK